MTPVKGIISGEYGNQGAAQMEDAYNRMAQEKAYKKMNPTKNVITTTRARELAAHQKAMQSNPDTGRNYKLKRFENVKSKVG